ncbi:prolyl oligopeptidase family serine peptidase [Actinoplanes sp. HUAS TT8]|uniref:S9 family peptidase n=1 Tax=Actinoplanes sp. HUAS TT8 TaxID=3447453 RepID=UPI003F5239E8
MTGLTAEIIVDGRGPRTPVISPDGRLVAYVVGDQIRPAGGDGSWAVDGSEPRWSADSSALFFLSGQVHRLDLADHAVTVLSDWPGEIVDHRPLAGSDLIALIAEDEPVVRDPIVAGVDEPFARLRLLDPGTGVITTPEVFAGRHVVELRQRPDGGPLAVLTRASADSDLGPRTCALHVFDPVTGAAEDLGPIEPDADSLAWWPEEDGWHLGWIALTPPVLHAGTAVFDLALTSGFRRNRTAGTEMCPAELCQTGAAPLVVFADGLDSTLARLDPAGLTTLSRHPGNLDGLTSTPGGGEIAVLAGSRYRPADVHIGSPGGPLRRVTDLHPELGGVTLGRQEPFTYRAADGLDLDGLLVLPPGSGEGPFPLVTIVHGGPYHRYADDFQPNPQWLATAGYAVFLPNPRGGQGHGHAFAARVAGRVGREEWTDILTGIDLLVDRGVADPGRLGISGWSHGGFMAAWAVGQSDRFRAALVGAGVTDWGMLAATGENGRFEAALGGSDGWSGIGPHPHDEVSPISYAGSIRTPVLLVHGAEDTNVPIGQAVYLHRALRHFGVEHEFVIYPREGHRIGEREHRLDLLHRTRAWFDRWL